LAVVVFALSACMPVIEETGTYIVAQNETSQQFLARLTGQHVLTTAAYQAVVELPPQSRTTLGDQGPGNEVVVRTVEILRPDCSIVGRLEFPSLIVIKDGPRIEEPTGGHNQPAADPPQETELCRTTASPGASR
jgi:hypothetical protein